MEVRAPSVNAITQMTTPPSSQDLLPSTTASPSLVHNPLNNFIPVLINTHPYYPVFIILNSHVSTSPLPSPTLYTTHHHLLLLITIDFQFYVSGTTNLKLAVPYSLISQLTCPLSITLTTHPHPSQLILTPHNSSSLLTTHPHPSQLILTPHNSCSPLTTHPHPSQLILAPYNSSSPLTTHSHPSQLILTPHNSCSPLTTHPHPSQLILAPHNSSSPLTTYPHSSQLILTPHNSSSLLTTHLYHHHRTHSQPSGPGQGH